MATFEEALGRFGIDRQEVKQADNLNTTLEAYIKDAGNVFVRLMQDSLDENNINASLMLRQSIKPNPTFSDGEINIRFDSDVDYALTRDRGISGTEVKRDTPYSFKSNRPDAEMVNDIAAWIVAKGLSLNEWAVAVNVLKRGYDGANFVDAAFNQQNLSRFENDLLTVVDNVTRGIFEKVIPDFK